MKRSKYYSTHKYTETFFYGLYEFWLTARPVNKKGQPKLYKADFYEVTGSGFNPGNIQPVLANTPQIAFGRLKRAIEDNYPIDPVIERLLNEDKNYLRRVEYSMKKQK